MCVPKFSALRKGVEEKDEKDFESLDFYTGLAISGIKHFLGGPTRACMLRDDDCISYVAYRIMLSDWRFKEDGGASKKTRRYRATRFAILRYLRDWKKDNRYHPSVDDRGSGVESVTFTTPLKLLINKEEAETDFDKFAEKSKLKPRQKECIVLSYNDELTDVEIAKRLGVSNGTVAYNIKTGLKKLRWAS